jgi:1,4-dihydroxy-2-naphthoate octaprenyltransferase
MKFSPGIVVAAIYVVIVYEITGDASQWWLWLSAIALTLVIDMFRHVHLEALPVTETKKVFVQDAEKPDEKDVQHPSNTV